MKPILLLVITYQFFGSCFCAAQTRDSVPGFNDFANKKFIHEHIIGEWRDQNSTITFKKGGYYNCTFNNGTVESGTYYITKRTFNLTPISPRGQSTEYCILDFTETEMKYQVCNSSIDPTVWIALKLKEPNKPMPIDNRVQDFHILQN